MDDIEFRDPPPKKTLKYRRRLDPLVQHPGRWAMVFTATNPQAAIQRASNWRCGRMLVPDGRWEFTSDGCEVFARYLGPEEEK